MNVTTKKYTPSLLLCLCAFSSVLEAPKVLASPSAGGYLDIQENSLVSNEGEGSKVAPVENRSYISHDVVITSPVIEAQNSGHIIVLPDLGGESIQDVARPVKKLGDSAGQTFNSQADNPFYSPPISSPLSNTPNTGGGPSNLPNMNNAPAQKGIPVVALGDANTGANITPTTTNVRFESKDYIGHIGVDYLTPGSSYGLGVKANGAYLLDKSVAVGANLLLNKNMKEAVFNGVWMPEDTNLKAKFSASYMVGQQDFNFYSGNSSANLSQVSYYFSTQYVVPKEKSDYLHSVGVSTWGSKANQTNNPDPIYSVATTSTAYQIMMDPRKLAVGTLQGESLDTQVGITKQVIAKASMGYEILKFPFSDGTQELDRRMYQDYVVQYQPIPELALLAGYKMGAALNNVMLSAAYAQWKITGFKNNGNNGITGNQGVLLSYSIPLDGNAKLAAVGTLTRPELIGNSTYILRDAATRPVQLPQAFLAKVDTTAVKMVASINRVGLPAGATVNAAGDMILTVGVGGGVITQTTRNGVSYSSGSVAQIVGSNLVIHVKQLPAASSGGDTYVFSVTDSGGSTYYVTITTQN